MLEATLHTSLAVSVVDLFASALSKHYTKNDYIVHKKKQLFFYERGSSEKFPTFLVLYKNENYESFCTLTFPLTKINKPCCKSTDVYIFV